ncbi:MAG: nucleotidyl transferase AbiEii/AbiGii toxin family protein [Gammaproteobacteria bacterium]|nr:nucleotidyl transferase AbiEii/AbiGii toxin family protein [Gammaproteobacteria bacterium]
MPGELNEQQIRKTAIQLGLPSDFVRKDYFVTKAIRLLTGIQNDYFELVFQGGTSLSKGYCLIKRLSEDVDFRVCFKPPALSLGKNAKRVQLRVFRNLLVDGLLKAEFDIQSEDVRVFYEGRYMSIRASFSGAGTLSYLKPHIAIDCFLGELELAPQIQNISSMVKVVLGDECDHHYFPVACVALDETAAEKWVALIRRIAGSSKKERDSDKHLVRHLYDLHNLRNNNCLSDKYYEVVEKVLKKEQAMFESGVDKVFFDPRLVLHDLRSNPKWKDHWVYFLEQMVYQSDRPSFEEALSVVEDLIRAHTL